MICEARSVLILFGAQDIKRIRIEPTVRLRSVCLFILKLKGKSPVALDGAFTFAYLFLMAAAGCYLAVING